MKFYETPAYKIDHAGQAKKRYTVTRCNRSYIVRAYDAADAIDRISTRYNWGKVYNLWIDIDTRGDLTASADVGWPSETKHRIHAILIVNGGC